MLKFCLKSSLIIKKGPYLLKNVVVKHLTNQSFFHFSNFTSGNLQKIIVGISMNNTDSLLQNLEELDTNNKELALMMIIDSVERNQLSHTFLENEKFEKIAFNFPTAFINSKLISNKHLLSQLPPLYSNFEENEDTIADLITKINNNFVTCSSQYKKIDDTNQLENYKFLVNRKFSDFYISHLSRYYNDQDKLKTFKNCIETYRKHNEKFIQPILKEGVLSLQKNPQKAAKIQKQLLEIIELFAQNVLHLNMIAKQTFQILQDEEVYKKECLTLKWEIGEILSSYHDIKDIDYISLEYIEIRRVRAAINYFLRCYNNKMKGEGEGAHRDALKELKKDLEEVIDNSIKYIHSKSSDPNNMKKTEELCMTILAVQGYLLRRHSAPLDQHKRQLYKVVDHILDGITNREMKENLEEKLKDCVDLIPHFEAFPNE